MKLICLPYAGGSAAIYHGWSKAFEKIAELLCLEYSGRGRRLNDALYGNIDECIDDLYNQINQMIKNEEVAFFGYSLGARLAYKLALRVEKERKDIQIKHIFFSAADAPHISETKRYSDLPDNDLIQVILGMGGTSTEVFQSDDLRALFLPIIRSDFKLAEEYRNEPLEQLHCDISVLYGTDDVEINKERIKEWDKCTDNTCKFYEFEGQHFFINTYQKNMIRLIATILRYEN